MTPIPRHAATATPPDAVRTLVRKAEVAWARHLTAALARAMMCGSWSNAFFVSWTRRTPPVPPRLDQTLCSPAGVPKLCQFGTLLAQFGFGLGGAEVANDVSRSGPL